MMWPFAEAADLKARANLADLVGQYTKLAKRGRALWGCCPLHGEKTPSFKVDSERFHCFGCGAHGDLFDFVAAVEDITALAAIERVRELVGGVQSKPSPKPAPPAPEPKTNNSKRAQELWRQTVRVRSSRLALDYLVCRRGITAWDDDRVRWHPAGYIVVPVVSCVTPNVDGAVGYTVAIWRIWPAMQGAVERKGLGPIKHNFAPVCATTGDEVAITEGVEDALAYFLLEGVPTWAALSSNFMADLILPDRFRRVVIVQDNDPPDRNGRRPGPEAAQKLARRLQAEGREVRIVASKFGKDANDALQGAVQ